MNIENENIFLKIESIMLIALKCLNRYVSKVEGKCQKMWCNKLLPNLKLQSEKNLLIFCTNNNYLKILFYASVIKVNMESVKAAESIMELTNKFVALIWPINWKLVPIKMVYFFFAMGMNFYFYMTITSMMNYIDWFYPYYMIKFLD